MTSPFSLPDSAREIFAVALRSVDAGAAVQGAVQLVGSKLTIVDTTIDLAVEETGVYVVAIGKAAPAMAAALDKLLGKRINAGVISGPAPSQRPDADAHQLATERWQFFSGGHPLPNQQSLSAAQAAFGLLKRADQERAIILFLISGGGSAMMDWPLVNRVPLADLIEANRLLVSCGASIAEINAVRRAISAVKGGRLAARAPRTTQISLIISDTNPGDEASVASGPTIDSPEDAPDARSVVGSYDTLANLPASILETIAHAEGRLPVPVEESSRRQHYVLLDNRTALAAAATAAQRSGYLTETAFDIVEPGIEKGCSLLLSRLEAWRSLNAENQRGVCLISGGEFLCPVRGDGVGGRNTETVLRWAMEIENRRGDQAGRIAVLSAGTDGIDGNSPATGAIADESTMQRARQLGLDPQGFLESSDAFNFFHQLGDTVVTGATGTNVRDVRILLAR